LKMNIAQSGQIISAAALVHNFIIGSREGVDEDTLVDVFDEEAYFRQFSANTVAELDNSLFEVTNSTRPVGVELLEHAAAIVTDNNEPNPGGRHTVAASINSKKDRYRLRRLITLHLSLYECWHDLHELLNIYCLCLSL
jgi:hypothetical protein